MGATTTRSVKLIRDFVAVLTGVRHDPLSQLPAKEYEQAKDSTKTISKLYIRSP